jgi:curli biogenesis system outer membrane secretion channel CsgG
MRRARATGFLFLGALGILCAHSSTASAQEKKASIAVMTFSYNAAVRDTQDGVTRAYMKEMETAALTNKFITALVQTGKFDVVDRDKLDKVLAEQQFGDSGMLDPDRCVKAGKIIGADYFLSGEISYFTAAEKIIENPYVPGDFSHDCQLKIVVDMRIVDTRTSKIVSAEKGQGEIRSKFKSPDGSFTRPSAEMRDQVQRVLCGNLVLKVIDGVYPIKVLNTNAQNVVFINRGEGGGVQVGETLDVFNLGEEMVDPDTGASLGRTETKVGGIRVSAVRPKFSECDLLGGTAPKGAICRPGPGDFQGAPPPPPPPADTTPPVVKILAPRPAQMLNSNPVNVVCEVTDDSGTVTKVTIAGAPATQDPQNPNRWRGRVRATDGSNRVVVSAWDPSNNQGSAEVVFQFKETPPTVEGQTIVTYKGRVDDAKSRVTVNGQAVTVNSDGTFECQVKPDASGNITVIATDEFGNETRKVEHVGG